MVQRLRPGAMAGLVVVLGSACPTEDGTADATGNGSDGGGGSTVASEPSGSNTSSDSNTSGVSDPTGDTGPGATSQGDSLDDGTVTGDDFTGALPCMGDSVAPQASTQTVTLTVVNDTAQPVFVAGKPSGCTPFDVLRDGLSLSFEHSYFCGCECPNPGMAGLQAVELLPEGSFQITWDARAMVTFNRREECFEDGSCFEDEDGALQPVEPGSVTVRVPLFGEAGSTSQGEARLPFQEACWSQMSFDVVFDLGKDDVDLMVPLSGVTINER
ncbi:MAG: hypothetical protein AAF799_23430 [Myxococcota bacterium]